MAIDTEAPPAPAAAVPAPPPRRPASAWLLPLVLLAVAGLLRFAYLGHPDRIYFDEQYYAEDAREYLRRGVETEFAVHPPVGKWLIAAGIAAVGYEPFGWRVSAAAAGTLTVLATYLAGLRLFRRRGIAALAALLLAVDGIALTMSRIAMLDIFLALFVTVGFWLLLIDRDRQWAALPHEAVTRPPPRPRRARWLAGVAFGLAVATKWSGLLALGAAGLFVVGSELAWRRRVTGSPWSGWPRLVASVGTTLMLVPAAVYLLSYAPWFASFEDTRPGDRLCPEGTCEISALEMAQGWWDEQAEILHFHRTLDAEHPYRAGAWTWPVLYRPVAYYYESCEPDRPEEDGPCEVEPGNVAEILGIGNPLIWWPALLAGYPLLAVGAVRWRDWRAWAVLAFLLGQYVPWLVLSRPLFFFYTTPLAPFVCLTLGYVAWRAWRVPGFRWLPAAIAVTAVGGLLFWYPILVGLEISEGAWRFRMLLRSWY